MKKEEADLVFYGFLSGSLGGVVGGSDIFMMWLGGCLGIILALSIQVGEVES